MKVIILGSGRVGSAIACDLVDRGHAVTVVDRDPDALIRLGDESFCGTFEIGDALDSSMFERIGMADAESFIACTDDDNTNIVVAQLVQRRFGVRNVLVRVFDPEKAEFYSRRGLRVICPTIRAIDEMIGAVEKAAQAGA